MQCTPDNVTVVTDKYYVCSVNTEGDTMAQPETLFWKSWTADPAKGTVPMNWAVNPSAGRFPGMMEYLYSTATPNDYFVAMQPMKFGMCCVPEEFASTQRL